MFGRPDHTYNDIREKSLMQWLNEMEQHPDIAVHGGVKLAREYVDHLKNGYVLSKGDKELEKAITHFLLELKPWNEALVYSIEKIQEYTGQRLIEKWEGWMKERHG